VTQSGFSNRQPVLAVCCILARAIPQSSLRQCNTGTVAPGFAQCENGGRHPRCADFHPDKTSIQSSFPLGKRNDGSSWPSSRLIFHAPVGFLLI
jgi:hypothetical protein